MVVDDDPFMRQLLRDLLLAAGVGAVVTAPGVPEALDRLHRAPIDIIFLDWEMGSVSGLDLINTIRDPAFGPMAFVPLVMVTAHAEEERVLEAKFAGINDFIVKPITAQTVLDRLERIINQPRDFVRSGSYFGPGPVAAAAMPVG